MKISSQTKNIIFFSYFILCGLFSLLPYLIFEVYELEHSLEILSFEIHILIILFVILFILLNREKFGKSKFKNKFVKPFIYMFMYLGYTFFLWMFTMFLVSGILLIINSIIGQQRDIIINSNVLKVEETKSKNGSIHNYIIVNVPEIKREVELKVNKEYKLNEIYVDSLKLGSLEMLYKYK